MYYAYDGSMHTITQALHEKHGPVVRMAPNYLDLDYDTAAALIKTCFDTKGVWRKVINHLGFPQDLEICPGRGWRC